MPKFVSKELPEDLYLRLSGHDIDRYLNHVILLYTVDTNGSPHPSLLSYFEVAARDRNNVRIATYKSSSTTGNMRRNGNVTLSIFDERVAYSIKGKAQEVRQERLQAERSALL